MASGPLVVTVSDFRRRLAVLIDEVDRHGHPLFVTQYGLVTAVLVSAEEYGTWRSADPADPDERRRWPAPQPSRLRISPSHRSSRSTPLPTTKVWTQYGRCDFETAQVLAEQGVETELVWTDEGWLLDDEG
jgi:prevent-host-death family protein